MKSNVVFDFLGNILDQRRTRNNKRTKYFDQKYKSGLSVLIN